MAGNSRSDLLPQVEAEIPFPLFLPGKQGGKSLLASSAGRLECTTAITMERMAYAGTRSASSCWNRLHCSASSTCLSSTPEVPVTAYFKSNSRDPIWALGSWKPRTPPCFPYWRASPAAWQFAACCASIMSLSRDSTIRFRRDMALGWKRNRYAPVIVQA